MRKILYACSRAKQIFNTPPKQQIKDLNINIVHQKRRHTKLLEKGKLKFMILEGGFPGCIDIGILFNVGKRDLTSKSSRSLAYLKNYTYLKQTMQETVANYQFFARSGSSISFIYDTQFTYIRSSFLKQDLQLMIDIKLDLALKKKNIENSNKLPPLSTEEYKIEQFAVQAAYNFKGIGLRQIESQLQNSQLQSFQNNFITPDNMLISIAGIPNQNYQEVIDLIQRKIQNNYHEFLQRNKKERISSQYLGGFHKKVSQAQELFQFGVVYQAVPRHHQKQELMHLIKSIMGNSSSFSQGGPGKGMNARACQRLMNGVNSIQKVSTVNQQFMDSGILGLCVNGSAIKHKQLVQVCIRQFKDLGQSISLEQLQRSKNILIRGIYQNVQRQAQHLEQASKSIFSYGRNKVYQYQKNIRKLTKDDVQNTIKQLMKTKPTIVMMGSQSTLRQAYSQQQVYSLLN